LLDLSQFLMDWLQIKNLEVSTSKLVASNIISL
jgi:hypothetical protein